MSEAFNQAQLILAEFDDYDAEHPVRLQLIADLCGDLAETRRALADMRDPLGRKKNEAALGDITATIDRYAAETDASIDADCAASTDPLVKRLYAVLLNRREAVQRRDEHHAHIVELHERIIAEDREELRLLRKYRDMNERKSRNE